VTTEPTKRVSYPMKDPKVMRAVAHPARIAILHHLSDHEATATECAEIVGLSPSATSYHLRALAKVGMVEEAPGRGDGRERVWRSPTRGFFLQVDENDGSDAISAALALMDVVLELDDAMARQWVGRSLDIPKEWSDGLGVHRNQLFITAAELVELQTTIAKMMDAYGRTTREDAPPGARKVVALFRAFPADPPERFLQPEEESEQSEE